MPRYFVHIIETVASSYTDIIEADSSGEARRMLEDQITNHPESVEPVSQKQLRIRYQISELIEEDGL